MSEQHSIRVSAKAVIVREKQILLIGYDFAGGYGFHYNLPGGGMEIGKGLLEALRHGCAKKPVSGSGRCSSSLGMFRSAIREGRLHPLSESILSLQVTSRKLAYTAATVG